MKLSVEQIKTAAVTACAVTLLFLTGCRTKEEDILHDDTLYQSISPSAAEQTGKGAAAPPPAENMSSAGELLEDAEPLVHSIKSTIDNDMQDAVPISIIGEFRTYYGDSKESRSSNIENAAKKLDGMVLKPGEVFSCHDAIAPFTVKNGYKPAGTYQDGKIVESIGGGVCQVSTTLYNAVLEAELKIVERAAHSMTVSYVGISMDAAIAGDYKDLKFKNTLKEPVTIHATTEDGWLIIEIEGTETRNAGREIEFETVILSETKPGKDVITTDESREDSYYKETQPSHKGYKAELYKNIYVNGVLTEKIRINESSYKASPKYVTKGAK